MVRVAAAVVALALAVTIGVLKLASGSSSRSCAVTLPNWKVPRDAGFRAAGFNYGNKKLRAQIWEGGRLVAGILPDGGSWAIVNDDGSIYAKQGWWRGVRGELAISGRRLDGSAPVLVANVPGGYGRDGFVPAGLTFPTAGCWEVSGRVGSARLPYTVKVTKLET
jgi:hypothetical protein